MGLYKYMIIKNDLRIKIVREGGGGTRPDDKDLQVLI